MLNNTHQIGNSDLFASRIGLGCMNISSTLEQEKISSIFSTALDNNIYLFDTADVYDNNQNEIIIGNNLINCKNKVVIATKCGIVNREKVNGSYDYIIQSCDASLKRLQVDCIDLFYLHRTDPNTPIEESMRALKELVNTGKVKYIGLSKVDEQTIRKAHEIHPLTAIQSEYSLWNRRTEYENVIKVCKELGIAFVAYSPLGKGRMTNKTQSAFFNDPKNSNSNKQQLFQLASQFAQEKKCSLAQLSLAWLLAKGDHIFAIPGSTNPQNIKDNVAALQIQLTPEDMEYLDKISDTRSTAQQPANSNNPPKFGG